MKTQNEAPLATVDQRASALALVAGSRPRLSVLTEDKIPVRGRAKHRTKHYAHDLQTGELITSSFQLRAVFAVLRTKGYSARDWITPQNTQASGAERPL